MRHFHPRQLTSACTFVALFGLGAGFLWAAEPVVSKKVDFESEVLPIFKRNCLACHSASSAESGVNLETPATIAKGGEDGPVVVPHKAGESLLLRSAMREKKPFMPPKNNKVGAEALKPEEVEVIRSWIDQGATGTVKAKPRLFQWRPLPPGLHPILAVAASADGQFAACGRANQIFVYHIPTGRLVARLTDPALEDKSGRSGYTGSAQRDFVQSLAFSPDGRQLASGEYRMVKFWQREPNLPQFTLGQKAATALAFSVDGKLGATGGEDGVVRLWDMAGGAMVRELTGHGGPITSLKFSPDGTKIASGSSDKSIRVWEVEGGAVYAQVETPGAVSALGWAMGGKTLVSAGSEDPVSRLWQVPLQAGDAMKPGKEMAGHTQPVTCLEVLPPDGKQMVTGSGDGTARVWSVEGAKEMLKVEHGGPVSGVGVAPNGKSFASAGGNAVRLWNKEKGQALGEIKGDGRLKAELARSERALGFAKTEADYWKTTQEGRAKDQVAKAEVVKKAKASLAAAQADWEKGSEAVKKSAAEKAAAVPKPEESKGAEAAPAAGATAAAPASGAPAMKPGAVDPLEDALKKAEVSRRVAEVALKLAEETMQALEKAIAEGRVAATKEAGVLEKGEADCARIRKDLLASEKPVHVVAFSPDGLSVATGGEGPLVQTWSAENGVEFDTYPASEGGVRAIGYSADGRIVSCAKAGGAVVWRTVASWTLARSIGSGDVKSALASRVLSLSFSADGQWLATGGGVPSRSGEVKIWKAADGTLVREVKDAHSDAVFCVEFSPDGKLLATASADKFVKVFEADSGKLAKALTGHTHYVLGVSWKADGRTLASVGADKALKVWSYPSGEQTQNAVTFSKELTSVRFLGAGAEMLAASGDSRVRLLQLEGKTVREFAGSKGYLFSAAGTPDGQLVIGGGEDSVLRIWNATNAKSLWNLTPPPPEIAVKDADMVRPGAVVK